MRSPTKVLLLEIDAGDHNLIRDWARAGILPTFRSLLGKGLVGHTMAPRGFFVGAIWPSFYTGVTPARHGIHSLLQLRPGTYEFFHCKTGDYVKREPFWNYLSRAGKRVAILDIPLSGISKELNGIQIVEWGSHDSTYGFMTWPPSLRADVKSRFGLYPLTQSCNADRRTPEGFLALRDTLISGARKKAELTKYYLNQGPWDFFAQVFTESHCVGHQCWHLHDPSHPGHEPEVARTTGDPIKDVYVAIDSAIGEVLAQIGDDTKVIVLAGHGMGSKHGAQFLLHEILVRLKVAVPFTSVSEPDKPPRLRDGLDSILTWGWQEIPSALKGTLRPVRDQLRDWIDGPMGIPAPKLDPTRGRCFIVENHFAVGGIRLNLAGREPNGTVQPGPEMDALCTQLKRDLREIRDLNTGKPVVSCVARTRDLYQGEYLDHLPDLLVEWSTEVPLGSATAGKPGSGVMRLGSDKIGVIEGENRYCRTGEHRPQGMFVAFGRGIKPGTLDRTVSIMDFAPTITKLLDVNLPDVDGEPIGGLLDAKVDD